MHDLRVLIVQPWLDWRGAETQSIQLVEDLQRLRVETRLVCLFVKPAANIDLIQDSIILPHPLLQKLLINRLMFSLLSLPVLCYLLWKHGREFSVFNPHNFPCVWAAVIVGYLLNRRVVWTAHNFPQHPFRGIWKELFERSTKVLDKALVRRCSKIIAVSRKVADQVKAFYGVSSVVVYPALNESCYLNPELRQNKYEGLKNVPEQATILLHCGRVCAEKMQQFTLDVFSLLARDDLNLYLVFAGSGNIEYLNLGEYSSRVVFLDFVEKPDLVSVYARARILIHPSSFGEGCTMVPFEAIASGTKEILLAKNSGADELLEGLRNCLIFRPEDGVVKTAECLQRLLEGENVTQKTDLPLNVNREFMAARYKEVFELVA